jgi:ribonuclease P protein component
MTSGSARRPKSLPEGREAAPRTRTLEVQGHAFPKHLRLLRRAEFRRVYEEGQRRSASLCTVFLRSNGLAHSRLGITVPVRVGKAVLRNRIKRRLREVFRLNRLAIPAGWDMVINPRAQVAEAEFSKLEREFLRLMPKEAPPPPARVPSASPEPPPRS